MKWKIKIPNSLSLRKLLYNKRFTIPFSLIAAFIFWLIIMINQNPDADRKHLPWADILFDEEEKVGPRSFKNMIFPWK